MSVYGWQKQSQIDGPSTSYVAQLQVRLLDLENAKGANVSMLNCLVLHILSKIYLSDLLLVVAMEYDDFLRQT